MNFGDVHSQTFEEWWQSEEEWCRSQIDSPFPCPSPIKPYYPESGKCLIDYRTVIEGDIYKIYRKFKKEQGREPNIKELIHNLKLYMNHWENDRIYLLIEYQHNSTSEISMEFQNYLRERKKAHPAREVSRSIKGAKGKATIKIKKEGKSFTIDDLERYLEVYDYDKEGLTIPEIVYKIWTVLPPDSNPENIGYDDRYQPDNLKSAIKRDLRKAKKIISNVEFGYFPGDY